MNEELKEIFTEDPENEQWQMILNFAYTRNIKEFFKDRNINIKNDKILGNIVGSIMQAREYFMASKKVSLYTSPLLLYYGISNLLLGFLSLSTGRLLDIENHGMRLTKNKKQLIRIADAEIRLCNPDKGALSQFCKVFAKDSMLSYSDTWTLLEILGSIPELKQDFEFCYRDAHAYSIPVEIVKRKNDYLERIKPTDLAKFKDIGDVFSRIENFSKCYLQPQYSDQIGHIILRKKISGKIIGIYSISGQKFLQIAHVKSGQNIIFPTIIYMYMGLYTLGYLSRYNPGIWNLFIRNDHTGEKQLITKFINLSRRFVPNLVLNYLYGMRINFVSHSQGILDLSKIMSENELRETVREEFKSFYKK